MKIPFSWLKEHTPLTDPAHAVAETLVRMGHEVEGVETPRTAVAGVLVGHIASKQPHPDADKLSLLKVDIGADAPLDIVCGASNMDAGDKVPVATIGTSLPNGLVIKKGKIRGETSFGMCCSEVELGLADESDGLLILPADAPVGAEVGDYLELEEAVFDLSITPNRGDCMSVHGLARDLAADYDLPLTAMAAEAVAEDAAVAEPKLAVVAGEDCPLYLARRIEGVKVGTSPAWMQQRLNQAGMRPVNGIVDVLNYVMLDIGQPMHAFDADCLQGGITVRPAADGEAFHALDGRNLDLAAGDLVVADEKGVVALAGIMGSEASGVTESTTSIMLESAFFRPARISLTRRSYAMVSEASMRFERGVDPAMVAHAMQRATAMIVALFGGRAGATATCGTSEGINSGRTVRFDMARMQSRLGIGIPESADAVLGRMGFGISRSGSTVEVSIPTHRHDVSIPEDMSEEYARIIGFDAIPEELPELINTTMPKKAHALDLAVAGGFTQVVNYAFISAGEQRLFVEEDGHDMPLANPISDAMSVMRRSMFPSLLNAAKHNLNRQQPGVALVEHGRIYEKKGDAHIEQNMLAWLVVGEMQQDEWYAEARNADFFDLKGAVEGWLAAMGLTGRFIADDAIQGLQAGQSAQIVVGRNKVGCIGRVDADIADGFDLDMPVFVATVDLDQLPQPKVAKFVPLPEFPGMARDLVFLFPRDTKAEEILQAATKAGGKLLVGARIFDRYTGKGVAEDEVSIGIRLELQSPDRTLTQEEVDAVSAAVIKAMQARFGAGLRG